MDVLFSKYIENYELLQGSDNNAREILKKKVDLADKMIGQLGEQGIKVLDRILSAFTTWVNNEENVRAEDDFSVI